MKKKKFSYVRQKYILVFKGLVVAYIRKMEKVRKLILISKNLHTNVKQKKN
jgi:hypothetical protein